MHTHFTQFIVALIKGKVLRDEPIKFSLHVGMFQLFQNGHHTEKNWRNLNEN